MKSFKVCLLLLMFTIQPSQTSTTERDPPVFKIDDLTVDSTSDTQKPQKFASQDIGRIVVVRLEQNQHYLMRVDPPEHCSRFIICGYEDGEDKVCAKETMSWVVYPSTGKVFESKNRIKKEIVQMDREIIRITAKTEKQIEIKISNEMRIVKTMKNKLRIETSSVYCKVHIGTAGGQDDEAPARYEIQWTGNNWDKLKPYLDEKESRKHLGPLFRSPSKIDNYKKDDNSLCPFAHDWMGFAKWSEAKNDKQRILYKESLWKNDIYEYSLKKGDANLKCGNVNPFQIDIEIGDDFKPMLDVRYQRCFGFALSFKKDFVDPQTVKPELKADQMFEFYLVSMMFLAPDSDKIRALRTNREALRKIRISFLNGDSTGVFSKNNYAIVEYGFLNNNIAGVREYVSLPVKFIENIESVSLLTEGFCKVRVLNVNHVSTDTPKDRCWSINGCNVWKNQKP